MVDDDRKKELRVSVDPHRCIAIGKCTAAAPGIYVIDEETGKAVLEDFEGATIEQLFAGARACPTQAIQIEQYGRRVFPQILPPMWGDVTPPGNKDNEGPSSEQ